MEFLVPILAFQLISLLSLVCREVAESKYFPPKFSLPDIFHVVSLFTIEIWHQFRSRIRLIYPPTRPDLKKSLLFTTGAMVLSVFMVAEKPSLAQSIAQILSGMLILYVKKTWIKTYFTRDLLSF